jgi:hypothetical protein
LPDLVVRLRQEALAGHARNGKTVIAVLWCPLGHLPIPGYNKVLHVYVDRRRVDTKENIEIFHHL